MGKVRRAGYVFVTWKGDHTPRHVHVYRDGKFIVKWDLENQRPMKGEAPRRVVELIGELESEGRL
ncbi:MAG: DUF4160 domain-containing protein [Candidatus Methylomirabilis oxyfera]|jgi:hypothetical protein|nr:DUF4160 domain-containing protein [Candidatus Methylomirabilis oxyfera]